MFLNAKKGVTAPKTKVSEQLHKKLYSKSTAKKIIRIIERLKMPLEIVVDDGEKFVKKSSNVRAFKELKEHFPDFLTKYSKY